MVVQLRCPGSELNLELENLCADFGTPPPSRQKCSERRAYLKGSSWATNTLRTQVVHIFLYPETFVKIPGSSMNCASIPPLSQGAYLRWVPVLRGPPMRGPSKIRSLAQAQSEGVLYAHTIHSIPYSNSNHEKTRSELPGNRTLLSFSFNPSRRNQINTNDRKWAHKCRFRAP